MMTVGWSRAPNHWVACELYRARIVGTAGSRDRYGRPAERASDDMSATTRGRIWKRGFAAIRRAERCVNVDALGVIGVRLALRLAAGIAPLGFERVHATALGLLFHGLKALMAADWKSGCDQSPLNVSALSSMVIRAGGLNQGHSMARPI
jgi:hypothetical protein